MNHNRWVAVWETLFLNKMITNEENYAWDVGGGLTSFIGPVHAKQQALTDKLNWFCGASVSDSEGSVERESITHLQSL